tara:strand:- start:19220 stop:19483 length:264 start_codon:yes stop_codon:yes gene_type:complete
MALLDGVAPSSFAITPNDNEDLAEDAYGIWVGVGGDIDIIHPDGTNTLHKNVPGGRTHPFVARRIKATLTAATDLVGVKLKTYDYRR